VAPAWVGVWRAAPTRGNSNSPYRSFTTSLFYNKLLSLLRKRQPQRQSLASVFYIGDYDAGWRNFRETREATLDKENLTTMPGGVIFGEKISTGCG